LSLPPVSRIYDYGLHALSLTWACIFSFHHKNWKKKTKGCGSHISFALSSTTRKNNGKKKTRNSGTHIRESSDMEERK
jgi:hypothetical protein